MKKGWLYFFLGVIVGVAIILTARFAYKIYIKPSGITQQKLEQAYSLSNGPKYKSSDQKSDIYSEYRDSKKPILKIRVINTDPNSSPENMKVGLVYDILAEKYSLEYAHDKYDILITGHFKYDNTPLKQDKVVSLYFTGEAYVGDPTPYLNQVDLALGFDYIDAPNYIRAPLPYLSISYLSSFPDAYNVNDIRHDFKRNGVCEPSKKEYFACFLASNHGDWFPEVSDGVYARDRLFHRLSLYKKVMSGGKHLNNIGKILPWDETNKWFDKCKFVIAYENTLNYPGYITEKPYQAWFAGSVPIYNAHKTVTSDINSKAIVYGGDFANDADLVEYIKKVDNDDKLYCEIWNQRLIADPSKDYEAIKERVRKKLFELIDEKIKK